MLSHYSHDYMLSHRNLAVPVYLSRNMMTLKYSLEMIRSESEISNKHAGIIQCDVIVIPMRYIEVVRFRCRIFSRYFLWLCGESLNFPKKRLEFDVLLKLVAGVTFSFAVLYNAFFIMKM